VALTAANANRIETSDLEAHLEAVVPTEVRFSQLSSGRFKSSVETIAIEGLVLYRERWNQRVQISGSIPDGCVLVGITRSPGLIWRGESVDTSSLILNDASTEMDFTTGGTADQLAMLISADRLLHYVGEELGTAIQNTREPLPRDAASIVSLTRTLRDTINMADSEQLDDNDICAAVEYELLDAVAQIYAEEPKGPVTRSKSPRNNALARAMDCARQLQRPLRVPDLAKQTGMSLRSLEYAFKESLGITPAKYLRWTRLNHVRRALAGAEPRSTTVTRAAVHWGFSDMSQVAVEYRHLFGESPSVTLARSSSSTGTFYPV
jgi:AraC family ethanolamine operon transcriptional activator